MILEPTLRAGETYALPADMSRSDAVSYWTGPDRETFVVEDGGAIVGTYYLRANQQGGGAHVANCGFMTAPWAAGRGIARAMCSHSLGRAAERGFRAMQFNFVVASNVRAVELWRTLGFQIVGRLPDAFLRPDGAYSDALVMYLKLEAQSSS
jgi:ribosomal protein S18 acetylase RimI-like enzyme